jgi:hypothetical protein
MSSDSSLKTVPNPARLSLQKVQKVIEIHLYTVRGHRAPFFDRERGWVGPWAWFRFFDMVSDTFSGAPPLLELLTAH